MTAARYTFGDSTPAAERLRLLADTFALTSEALLREHVRTPPALAVDLGCGPGSTTRMVAAATGARRTVGLDSSEAFVAAALEDAPASVTFATADVRGAWPLDGPPDLVYARLLLAHLPDPIGVALDWLSRLEPGGLLVLDEQDHIDSGEPALTRHLDLAVERVAATGAQMFAGTQLAALDPGALGETVANRLRPAPIAVARAATLFGQNLAVWRADGTVDRPEAELDEREAELAALAAGPPEATATWGLRQVVIRRR